MRAGCLRLLALSLLIALAGCSGESAERTPSASSVTPSDSPSLGVVHLSGVSYGPFHRGQKPDGIRPSALDVATDIPTLAAIADEIRIYSSQGSAAFIVRDAAKARLSVNLGIWLGTDAKNNERELAAGIRLMANAAVTTVTVGNEVLFRGDLSEAQLASAIRRVRRAATRLSRAVRVTTADTDATWRAHPELAADLDVVTAHIYPFWAQVPVEGAVAALDASYRALTSEFAGKPVIIGETGWPSGGPSQGRALPSAENQARFLRDFVLWTRAQSPAVEYFWFEAFDEAWKSTEAGVGTHWGLMGESGVVKEALREFLPTASAVTVSRRSRPVAPTGSTP